MENKPGIAAFWVELDQYRRYGKRVSPEEIVASALRHGVPAREILSVLYKQFSYVRDSDALSIPLEFFGELSKLLIAHSILELTNVPYLLSAYAAERAEQNLTVICREKAFSEILGQIFLGRVKCANELSEIERGAPFDLIIFQEFMGLGRALRQTC